MTKNKIRVICIVMILTIATLVAVAATDGVQKSQEIQEQNANSICINQMEYERVNANQLSLIQENLREFSQNAPLTPARYADEYGWTEHYATGLWTEIENVRDKIVTVTNLSSCPVYFRTVIALEADQTNFNNLIKMNLNMADYDWNQAAEGNGIELIENVNITYTYDPNPTDNKVETVTASGVFDIIVGTYIKDNNNAGAGVLTVNATSTPSLLQVAMHKDAKIQQIQQFGDNYEILVTSQAVAVTSESTDPVSALNAAFTVITKDNHPWITTSAGEGEGNNTSTTLAGNNN